MRRFPWIASSVWCAAALCAVWPGAAAWMVGDREALAAGECWRAWTAQLAHFSWSHLLASGAVWWVAAGALERGNRRALLVLLVCIGPVVTAAALAGEGELACYGGLSGLATAAAAWLGVGGVLRSRGRERLLPLATLLAVGIFLADELVSARANSGGSLPRVAQFASTVLPVRVAVWAHVAGALAGGLAGAWETWREKLRPPVNKPAAVAGESPG